jgi:endonuclease/exonuclease/phosphatase family metal-dependent hydrolase
MRLAVAASLIVVLGSQVASRQDQTGNSFPRRQAGYTVELSEMLTHSPLAPCTDGGTAAPRRVRIGTWNIRAGRSAPLDEIAAEVRAMQADVVALQEVDVKTRRSGFVDQPVTLATALGYNYAFAASIKWDEGDYGLALLSRWPIVSVQRHRLDPVIAAEPRIVLDARICAAGRQIRVFNHHADGRTASRHDGFLSLKRIMDAENAGDLLVVGDFNEPPDGSNVRSLIETGLLDLGAAANLTTAGGSRIDYLLASGPFTRLLTPARVWPTDKSDHYAVLTDLQW